MACFVVFTFLLVLTSDVFVQAAISNPLVVIQIPPEEAPSVICCNLPLQCDKSCNPPRWHYNTISVPLCYCDSPCELFGDCCSNYQRVGACQKTRSAPNESGLGSGSDASSFEPLASGQIDVVESTVADPLFTTSPEVPPLHESSLAAPMMPSGIHQQTDGENGAGLSSSLIAEFSSINLDYSWEMGAEEEFAMMQSCVVTSFPHTYSETNVTKNVGAYMVSICPYGSDVALEIRYRCESYNYGADFDVLFEDIRDDFADVIPVTDSTKHAVHYRNMYCAFCNEVPIENMLPWDLAYLDTDNIPFWFQPKQENTTRRCFANSLTRRPSLLEGIPLADTCKASIEYDQGTGCLSCYSDNLLDLGIRACYKPPSSMSGTEEPLAIPFDFRSYASKAVLVSTNEIHCPKGFQFSEKKKKCLPFKPMRDVSPPCGQLELLSSSYYVKMSFVSEDPETTSLELIKIFSLHMNYSLDQIENETISETGLANDMEQKPKRCKKSIEKTTCNDSVTKLLQFEVISTEATGFNVTNTRYLMDQLPNILVNMSVEIQWIEYVQPCGQFSVLECKGEIFNSDVVSFMKLNNTLLTNTDMSDEKMYVTNRVMSKVTYRIQSNPNMHPVEDIQEQVILCNGVEVLKCPSISIAKTNYILNEVNNRLQISSTGQIYNSDQYIILPNKTALVCVEMGDRVWQQLSTVMFFVYIIGTSISLFALLLTFLTYCALPALRTVPGIATMNFIVASFVAQFGLLIGGRRIEDTPIQLCTFIAISLHYVWLASFFWTTALAFDVSRTLGTGMQPGGGGRGKKLFLYSVFSWGGPLLIIFPSLVFHFCDCTHGPCCTKIAFSYGTNDVCWIRPQTSNLVAFGVPVMFSLLFNIGLFSRTVSGVRSSKRATSIIERRRVSVVQRAMNEFTIYIKVSMLMGFSWIWGFLFGFTGIAALWTIFVIFNSVQGIFIFWAFACTSRVLGMMKTRFRPPGNSRNGTPSPGDYLGPESQTRTKRISVFSIKS